MRPKWTTKAFWEDSWNIMLARLGRPKGMPAGIEARLEAAKKLQMSDGVSILQIDTWTEGPKPCRTHCWHKVHASNSHRGTVVGAKEHLDYVCCQCTHGMCHVSYGDGPIISHPMPKQHARILRK